MSQVCRRAVNIINLGRMGYMAAHDIQTRYARDHLDEISGRPNVNALDILLLVEHNPVYTIGIRRKDYTAVDERRLKDVGAEFYHTNRGGLITFHGPGQLVAYPILNLKHFQPSIKWYVKTLERTIINTCKMFGIKARTTENTGVWIEDRKIAAIGVHGSRYVTTHGISINANTDLSWYDHIVPCGVEGKSVTSLSKEVDENITVEETIPRFLESFEQEFDCQVEFSLLEEHEHIFIPKKHSATTVVANAE